MKLKIIITEFVLPNQSVIVLALNCAQQNLLILMFLYLPHPCISALLLPVPLYPLPPPQCQNLPSSTPPLLFPPSTPVPSRLCPQAVAMASAPLLEVSRRQHSRLCHSSATRHERCPPASASRSTSSCWRGASLYPPGLCPSPRRDVPPLLNPQQQ